MQADQLLVILLLGNLLGMTGKDIHAISEIKQYLYEASNNTQQNLDEIFGSHLLAIRLPLAFSYAIRLVSKKRLLTCPSIGSAEPDDYGLHGE
jgi:hypothetical protein